MIKYVNSNSLQRANTFDDLLDQALQPGFAGMELNLDQNLGLYPEIKNETLATIYQKARLKNVAIPSLTSCSNDLFDLCTENEEARNTAQEYFIKLIDCAALFDAITIIPAHQTLALGSLLEGSYEQAHYHLFTSLKILAAHAEIKSIHLALEIPGSGLLQSPLELRELIDQVNNPYMGLCLNPQYIEQNADPLDWFNILNPRIIILHLPIGKLSDKLPLKCQQILDLRRLKNILLPVVYSVTQ
ncbi:MAG: sugar phosphate isomerase/epimerase [Planctomycetes bacterium]|nr:sugar phosphate isomerase/epimerase [Planctomycetota bacterium]